MAETKRCPACEVEKRREEFHRSRTRYDGLQVCCKPCHKERTRASAVRECPKCGGVKSGGERTATCWSCYLAENGKGDGWTNAQGYRMVYRPGHSNAQSKGRILEHVFVMSEHLGRPLLPGENVHHKNGDRADNRIENLELWSTSQPAGQRVVDKVQWAREIIAQYEPELDKLGEENA